MPAQIRLGDQLGGPGRSPLAGLEGDSQFNDPVSLSAQFTAPDGRTARRADDHGRNRPRLARLLAHSTARRADEDEDRAHASSQYQLAGQFRSQPQPTKRVDNEAWVGLTIEEHAGRVTWYAPITLATASIRLAHDRRPSADARMQGSCVPVTKDFSARLGRGVPIGELASASGRHEQRSLSHPSPPPPIVFQPEGSEVKISGRLIPGIPAPETVPASKSPSLLRHWHIYSYADRDDQPGSKPTLIAFDQLSGLKSGRPVPPPP